MEKYWRYVIIVFIFICLLHLYLDFSRQTYDISERKITPYHKRLEISSPFNASHCTELQNLKQVLVAINYNFPHYSSIPILKTMYETIFGKVVFCGNMEYDGVIKINERHGYVGYECVATAIRMFPQFTGYFHINDDVIVNWWNYLQMDLSKIWIGSRINYNNGHVFGDHKLPDWHWWRTENAAGLCEVAFKKIVNLSNTKEGIQLDLPIYLKRYFSNTNNRKLCVHSWSDVFYIPKEFSKTYARLSQIYKDNNVFLEVAVPGILSFFLNKTNHINLNGIFLSTVYGYSQKYLSGEAFYEIYSFDSSFFHPFKLEGKMYIANYNFLKNVVIAHGENVKHYCSLKKAAPFKNYVIPSRKDRETQKRSGNTMPTPVT